MTTNIWHENFEAKILEVLIKERAKILKYLGILVAVETDVSMRSPLIKKIDKIRLSLLSTLKRKDKALGMWTLTERKAMERNLLTRSV